MRRRLLWPVGWSSMKMMGMEPAGRGERTIGWSVGFGEEGKISCDWLKKKKKIEKRECRAGRVED